ncbi:MAG: Ldh family oxidoreductase [Rhodospirillales bacterium]|nr:Ldh family oxidoreductase [Rhodospirillales bacterium]
MVAGAEAEAALDADRRVVAVDGLAGFVKNVCVRVGMPDDDAGIMADRLVGAHLRGFDTHGTGCLPNYARNLLEGRVNRQPAMKLERRAPWAWSVDADNGFGHVAATRAMRAVLESVRDIGIGVASIRNSNHLGAACLYPLMAVEEGYIGIAMVNCSAHVAPYGSREKLFGTNPISIAAPAGERAPFVLDMATSAAARRKFRLALEMGEAIPEGWALDAEGNPTTDPAAALEGSAVPSGGAKGSGLAMAVEVLAGVMSGAAFGGGVLDLFSNHDRIVNSGNFLMALDPAVFLPDDEFKSRMDLLINRLTSSQPAPGVARVRYPGERGAKLEIERRQNGIPLPPTMIRDLQDLAEELDLPFPA